MSGSPKVWIGATIEGTSKPMLDAASTATVRWGADTIAEPSTSAVAAMKPSRERTISCLLPLTKVNAAAGKGAANSIAIAERQAEDARQDAVVDAEHRETDRP